MIPTDEFTQFDDTNTSRCNGARFNMECMESLKVWPPNSFPCGHALNNFVLLARIDEFLCALLEKLHFQQITGGWY